MATATEVGGRRVLVTGGNRGLGREVCRQLIARGDSVLLAARDGAAAEAAAAELGATPLTLDVTAPASVARAAEAVRESGGLDVLVNNAGVALDGFDADVARRTLDVNFHGVLALTDALVPLLPESGTVVMVSSGMGGLDCLSTERQRDYADPSLGRERLLTLLDGFVASVADGSYASLGYPDSAYSVSKVGLNALARILARHWTGGPRVLTVCPGWVRTRMGGRSATRDVEEGARGIVWAATRPPDFATGGFFRDGRAIRW